LRGRSEDKSRGALASDGARTSSFNAFAGGTTPTTERVADAARARGKSEAVNGQTAGKEPLGAVRRDTTRAERVPGETSSSGLTKTTTVDKSARIAIGICGTVNLSVRDGDQDSKKSQKEESFGQHGKGWRRYL